jgi:DNA (cytosine-5)-methyltransferase 1
MILITKAGERRRKELIVDNFAGGGGASLGIRRATGRGPHLAINHDAAAIAMHKANHPETRHMLADVWSVDPKRSTKGRPVGLLWASPDCRHFSRAKGGKPVKKSVRSLAFVVVKWAREVKPRVIILENVREFAGWGPLTAVLECGACGERTTAAEAKPSGERVRCPSCDSLRLQPTGDELPDPKRKGLTFRRWVGRLRALGYKVEWKVLDAADYGAPTHRRRLFLVARCDGKFINWPEPSHGDPTKLDDAPLLAKLEPWRTAAECIDWALPCPSIFDRKKPLAEKTMRRIALGFKRYVLEAVKPFIVGVGGRMGQSPASPVDAPSNTVTTKNDRGLVDATLVAAPFITEVAHGDFKDGTSGKRVASIEQPLGALHGQGGTRSLTAAYLCRFNTEKSPGDNRAESVEEPLSNLDTQNRFGLVTAFIAKHFGGVVGHGVEVPIGTVTSIDHHALVAASLMKFRGDSAGQSLEEPMPTVTSGQGSARPAGAAHALGLQAGYLVKFNHGDKQWYPPSEPLPAVTSQGNKFGLVFAFLVKYFGTAIGQPLDEPLGTCTGKHRFGIVAVEVSPGVVEPAVAIEIEGLGVWAVADIGMRMLTPRELARAQGFDEAYKLTGTKTNQVAKIGNSVSPYPAEAMVRANFDGELYAGSR